MKELVRRARTITADALLAVPCPGCGSQEHQVCIRDGRYIIDHCYERYDNWLTIAAQWHTFGVSQ